LHEDLVVDIFLAKFVFDDGDAQAVLLLQDSVEQRCFAGAEEAGQDGAGDQFHMSLSNRVSRAGRGESEDYAGIYGSSPLTMPVCRL
jgi:hypothetical protein